MKRKTSWQDFLDNSYLFAGNAGFIEDIYAAYLHNPDDVGEEWRGFFDSLPAAKGNGSAKDVDHDAIRNAFVQQSKLARQLRQQDFSQVIASVETKQVAILQIINAYRFRGHQDANIDPLGLNPNPPLPDLQAQYHGLSESDMDVIFNVGSLVGPEHATLREILSHLQETYCEHIGAEYMHITSTSQKRWLQERLEGPRSKLTLTPERKREVLARLAAAEGLEKYLHTKYVGQKRFSVEGAESVIPLLDCLIQRAGVNGVEEVVLGMAHRGRLNVLINVLGKSPAVLFQEFEGYFDPSTNEGSGDVKYHQGFSSDIQTAGNTVHLALSFNPSHLEIISPVVEGSVRARQQRRNDGEGRKVLPILIHGDAAFAGQGVVMESFNMSQARGYKTGGSVHVIINNQIGFTTSNPLDARSTPYCTEVARMVQAPIIHVNGDDPEAVLFATELAFDFRSQFRRDVVIDLVCYRRHGHSEADEPAATQPMMYQKIRRHDSVTKIYAERLVSQGVIGAEEIQRIETAYREALDQGITVAPQVKKEANPKMVDWSVYRKTAWDYPVKTTISREVIADLTAAFTAIPDGFRLHPRVAKIIEERQAMANGELGLDWGFAETLAHATLLRDGFSVRISGQDSGRGTFFHRHAVLHDQNSGEPFTPLQTLAQENTYFIVIDSLLSEEAVLGFEYGYSATDPRCLTIWEAQFGDFANGAQVVIDQFICSGESKWSRLSGLVMFLPHGFDGQGPEHSSARLERYLQLCAEENIHVVVPSVPAQMFHVLRRQMLRPYRKPLIIMTPKSLLRHRDSTSQLSDISDGGFQCVFDDNEVADPMSVTRVVLCCGKVYFDLIQERKRLESHDTAIVRVEQLYPFPETLLTEVLKRYSHAKKIVWCQEEPNNQGAWQFMHPYLAKLASSRQKVLYAGRPAAASPAVGYLKKHLEQQRQLVEDAFSI